MEGMKDKRPSAGAPMGVALLILSALIVPYVAGYFWLSIPVEELGEYERERMVRIYQWHWQAGIFCPAAMVESAVSPYDVSTAADSSSTL
jgi:hypothetical protein